MTSEDYLWVQLVLAREDADALGGGEKWGLGDVAKSVVKAGRTAWDRSGQRPEGYFLVLILVGEYERVSPPVCFRLTLGRALSVESFTWRGRTFRNCVGMLRIITYFIICKSFRRRSP